MIYPDTQKRLRWSDETTKAFTNDFNKVLHWLPALRRNDLNWEYPDKPAYPNRIENGGVYKYYRPQLEKVARALDELDNEVGRLKNT